MISRRSLFSFLAAAPVGAVAAVRAVAEARSVDPPMIGIGDKIEGPIFRKDYINWVDPDYDERTGEVLRPLLTASECEQRREAIRAMMERADFSAYWKT